MRTFAVAWKRMSEAERFGHIERATRGGDRWRRRNPELVAERRAKGGAATARWWAALPLEEKEIRIARVVANNLRLWAEAAGKPTPVVYVQSASDGQWRPVEGMMPAEGG
jgi:hypothetical protein